MTFSPDSKYIATGSHTGKVNLIGVESGVKEETLDTRSKFTMSIAYVSGVVSSIRVFNDWKLREQTYPLHNQKIQQIQ